MAKLIRRSIAILLTVTAVILLVLPAFTVQAIYTNDFEVDGGVLSKYTGTESNITIPLGVSEIGKDAFSGNNNITSVYIPEEVTTIDYAAFENCKNLQKVVIEDNVRSIGSSAFSGCTSLTTINIPKRCETLGSGVFAACPNLSFVTVDSGNRNFICLDGVIYSKDGRKLYQYLAGRPYSTYEIPQPVKEIGEFGFYGANMLTNVEIAKGVDEIPEYAFLNCKALNKVTIPSTVKAIRKGAFGGCPNLTELAVPASVGYIDSNAFTALDGSKGDVVDSNSGSVLSQSDESQPGSQESGESNSPDSLESTDVSSTSEASPSPDSTNDLNSTEASQPAETPDNSEYPDENNLLSNIQNTPFSNDDSAYGDLGRTHVIGGEAVFLINPTSMKVKGFDIDSAQTEDSISDSGNSSASGEDIRRYSGQEFDIIGGALGHYGKNEPVVNIPSDVTKLGNRVFYNNKTIEQVNLPSSLHEIGDFAFARSTLNSIDIPSGVESIGYAAFYNCKNLSDINIPESVKNIELGAFDGTKYIENWNNIQDGNNFLIVGDGILIAYKGVGESVTIPETVKQIGAGVFEGNKKIKSVTIPETVKKIGEDAFNGCMQLSGITLPSNLEVIEDRAFKDTSLSRVIIPLNVKSIGLGAFDTAYVNGGLEYLEFKGNILPDTTYKPTAERLSARDLRTLAFNGTDYAVIGPGTDINSGTIFDPNTYGFRGQVYSYADKPTVKNQKKIELRRCIKEPDLSGNVTIDNEIELDGYKCQLSGVKQSALEYYKDPYWCENAITDITLDGDISEALNQLISDVSFAISTGNNTNAANDKSAISINDNGLFNGDVKAVLPSNTEKFNMTITKDDKSREAFERAFDNRYGTHEGVIMENIDIEMTDRLNFMPIKKMATSKLEVTVPVPSSLANAPNIRVATLDENGLLEEVSSNISGGAPANANDLNIENSEAAADGTDILEAEENSRNTDIPGDRKISFVLSHLSPYIIYTMTGDMTALSYNEIMTENIEIEQPEALSGNTMEITMQTLTKNVGVVPVRVIIATAFIITAVILFIYKPARKIKRST